ncbi:cytochrome c oxidase, cbb3-type, subunit III [Loktanella fryxellensis]|uniref:Cytochrome c oxidase, cbb3-type, subunit III n=1 Tax=Loktanella fryxellensis TaxID=245187 RepID=A0A1H8HJ34_9RHOB|nr:cbb3-type cytochrome c oxidase N-terminal domain-containing protein [Loktanella fryxellensis]SEN56200.1 cytochrome c oxidase, cbb3-type, subunit III [Loktanella fryxellensis]
MTVKAHDPLTGHRTTGHEWDGITEWTTCVPRSVWVFIVVTRLLALVLWILLPAWPLGATHTRGLLGVDQRDAVADDIALATLARADWMQLVATLPTDRIMADPARMARLTGTAHQFFGENCAGCHGSAAAVAGFASLIDADWLWGGDTDTVRETLRVGIDATHPDTRHAQMLAFGAHGILPAADICLVVNYVQSLSATSGGIVAADA